ncbi:MAG: hypothetical protein MZV63_24990 [Marinilabiliales bacterium]|nr:hypothetical protein [Marinilabiliales bacterium]
MDEIYKYSVVASVIAEENEFDIIHAHDWLAYPAGIAANGGLGQAAGDTCSCNRFRPKRRKCQS